MSKEQAIRGAVVDISKELGAIVAFSDGGEVERLPYAVYQRLDALQDVQQSFDDIYAEYVKERARLEAKFLALYEPLFSKRADIISGRIDPAVSGELNDPTRHLDRLMAIAGVTDNDLDSDSDSEVTNGHRTKTQEVDEVVGVPGFWLQVFKNNAELAHLITKRDEDALLYLSDVRYDYLAQMKGFRLSFHFLRNPYFKNSEIIKEYHISNLFHAEEPVLENVTGTAISWKRGMDLTQRAVVVRGKSGNIVGEKWVTCPSFFSFFSGPQLTMRPANSEEEIYAQVEADLELGFTFMNKIISRAMKWYTGEACDDEESVDEEAEDFVDLVTAQHKISEVEDDGLDETSMIDTAKNVGLELSDKPERFVAVDGIEEEGNAEIKQALKEAFASKYQQFRQAQPNDENCPPECAHQ